MRWYVTMGDRNDITIRAGAFTRRQPWAIALATVMFIAGTLAGALSRSTIEHEGPLDSPPLDAGEVVASACQAGDAASNVADADSGASGTTGGSSTVSAAVRNLEAEIDGTGALPEDTSERSAPSADLDGWWLLTNSVESTAYARYRRLRIGYRVFLEQDGDRITGHGTKWSENGRLIPAAQQTPIELTGAFADGRLRLQFVERGTRGASSGSFTWKLAAGRKRFHGDFVSSVADTRGSSTGVKL